MHTIIRTEIPDNKHPSPCSHDQRNNSQGQEDSIHNDELGPLVFRVDKVGGLARRRAHGRDRLCVSHGS